MRNVNTIRQESRNIRTQSEEIKDTNQIGNPLSEIKVPDLAYVSEVELLSLLVYWPLNTEIYWTISMENNQSH